MGLKNYEALCKTDTKHKPLQSLTLVNKHYIQITVFNLADACFIIQNRDGEFGGLMFL